LAGSALRNAQREAFAGALILVCRQKGGWTWLSKEEIIPVLNKMGCFWADGDNEGWKQASGMVNEGLLAISFAVGRFGQIKMSWRVTPKLLELLITSQYSGGVVYENKKDLLLKLKATKELND